MGGVLALSAILLSSTVLATETTKIRAEGIQSHGTFVAQSQNGDEVLITANDLLYLADEIDELEEWYREAVKQAWLDGYEAHVPGDASIEYEYHVHTGSPTSGGGCYKKVHEHTAAFCTWWNCTNPGCSYTVKHSESAGVMQSYCYDCGTWTCTQAYYVCNPSMNGYYNKIVLGCGKTPDTIVAARIVYNN